jgi:hypothetical protein
MDGAATVLEPVSLPVVVSLSELLPPQPAVRAMAAHSRREGKCLNMKAYVVDER